MKTLYITRHADAVPHAANGRDFVRTLSAQGECDAKKTGGQLQKTGVSVSLMASSPAVRALKTCILLATALGYKVEKIHTSNTLYGAGIADWLTVIGLLDNAHDQVMIVGHNPGCTHVVSSLLNTEFTSLPTCGVVSAKLRIASWKEVKAGCGEINFFYSPHSSQ